MEFRAGEEHGFARIWGHAHVVFSETPTSQTKVEHALISPGDAVAWLANVVDIQNDNGTASGRVDAYLRPPGLPDALPEVALDIDVPAISGTDERGRDRLQGLLRRYTRAPSIHLRFWYTTRDPRTDMDRRIAASRPLAHLLISDVAATAPRPTVRSARELGDRSAPLGGAGRTRCGGRLAGDTVHGVLSGAHESIRDGRAELCGICFAPAGM
jgi:hypothetical protein